MRYQHSLQLAPHELHHVKHLVQAHRTPQAVARRAGLIEAWHAHPGWNTQQFARALNRHENWVRKWRRRWEERHRLQDAPRSGAPRQFSRRGFVRRSQRWRVVCLARMRVPLARWSRAELARQVGAVPTLPTISARTIGRWLTAEQIHPWRFHAWQHIQNPEEFLQRTRHSFVSRRKLGGLHR